LWEKRFEAPGFNQVTFSIKLTQKRRSNSSAIWMTAPDKNTTGRSSKIEHEEVEHLSFQVDLHALADERLNQVVVRAENDLKKNKSPKLELKCDLLYLL